MDLSYYDLEKGPFNITPDPEFLSLNRDTREALASIIYGVENKRGFVVITGEVGVGKTTILRSYLRRADKAHLKVVYIFNSNITFKELLKAVFRELDLSPETDEVFEMVNRLHRFLIEEYRQGNNVVLIVDEAQNMPKETLENLRMLSNLETPTEKLLQIVLVGQPELEQMLDSKQLRQLKQRVAFCHRISPLTEKESLAYVQYRLAKVATSDSPVFTRGALKKIVRKAKGIPRILNVLCDNALVTGFGYQVRPVNARIAREVIADFEGEKRSPMPRRVFISAVVIIFMTGLFWFAPSNAFWPDLEKIISKIYVDSPAEEEIASSTESPAVLQRTFSIHDDLDLGVHEEAQRVEEDEIVRLPAEQFPKIRMLEEGDSLYRLTMDIYGFTNPKLINWIKQNNPKIKNIHRLQAGELILFPGIDEGEFMAHAKSS